MDVHGTESWDATYPAYFQLADVLAAVAESHCGVTIDDGTRMRWRELMGIMREIDTHADDTVDGRHDVIDELTSFSRFRGRYPHIAPEAMGQVMQASLIKRTQRILRLGSMVAAADTPYRYIHLRAAEAVQTAEIFYDSAGEAVRDDPAFSTSFMPMLRAMGVAACMLDSAHDAPRDYVEGKMMLSPQIGFRGRMAGISLQHTIPNIHAVLHVPVAKEMWKAASIRRRRAAYAAQSQ